MARILYVEDNPENRLLVRRLLSVMGHELIEAEGADQLRALLDQGLQPDLILLDLHLPDVDGYTIARQLRQRPELSRVPIVALTADVLKDTPIRCFQVGCDGYIPKPLDIDAFPQLIEKYLHTPVFHERGS